MFSMTMGDGEQDEEDNFADNPFGMDDDDYNPNENKLPDLANGGMKVIGGAVNPTAVTFTKE